MILNISEETKLMEDSEEQRAFAVAVEQGLQDAEAGRVRPAREALVQLGAKFGALILRTPRSPETQHRQECLCH